MSDTWASGIAGNPVAFVAGPDQHAFARGTDGSLQHSYWDPSAGPAAEHLGHRARRRSDR